MTKKQKECWELTFSEYAKKNNIALPDEMELDRTEATSAWFDEFKPWGEMLGQMSERLQADDNTVSLSECEGER